MTDLIKLANEAGHECLVEAGDEEALKRLSALGYSEEAGSGASRAAKKTTKKKASSKPKAD